MRTRTVTTDDDRTLDVAEVGPEAGWPVLLHHGTPGSRLVLAHVAAAATRAGARLVSFSRPGYGGSTPSAPGLATGGRDALTVLDALAIESAPVVGISGGGPFAAATALAGGDRVSSLCLLAGVGPQLELGGEVPEEERVIARAVAEGRTDEAFAVVRAQAAAMLGQVVGLPGDDLLRTFEQLIPPNEANPDPDFRRWMADDLEEALRVGVDGFAGDNVSWGYTWDIDPSEVRQRTLLRYGSDDGMVPPAHGEWWHRRIPHAELVVGAGEGHGDMSFRHWDEVFAWLRT